MRTPPSLGLKVYFLLSQTNLPPSGLRMGSLAERCVAPFQPHPFIYYQIEPAQVSFEDG